mmetsp:Transcript_33312/g.71959  ORF Transcript_33312/g.71959 Transcript_33312/m.71959 type:complete len:93 (+) Transcript_33312:1-279(+)
MDLGSALGSVSEQDRQAMLAVLEDMQIKESLSMYNSLAERCFSSCVTSFRSKALEPSEEKCMRKCTEKFINVSRRVSQRFAEQQAEMPGPGK